MADEAPLLFSRELQMGAEKKPQAMALGEAVTRGIIANETLGYFIGRTHLFLKRVGLTTEVDTVPPSTYVATYAVKYIYVYVLYTYITNSYYMLTS